MSEENIVTAENVRFSYPDIRNELKKTPEVLKGVSIDIHSGEFTAVLGHNGSGKSTFARLINAILVPSSGTVYVSGMDTKDDENLFAIRQKAGMVFQNPDNQLVATIVEEDVAFGLENLGVEYTEMRKRVDDALKSVNMYEYRNHSPHQLSGGQKQRVAIAGVIAMRPQCIILDEPTAMLDPSGRREVINTIKKLNREYGITVILITHYMEEAAQADRVVVMDNGSVVLDDTPEIVFSNVELLKKLGLDVPQVTELVYELNKAGLNLDKHIITEQQCIDALTILLKGR
ncbi:MAG: energy-coupling factor transporter ATPase [Oscillospiraceae bacterium]|nr:energy-coupling factor transporter ATPase [Oscillospiraceae bacterium]